LLGVSPNRWESKNEKPTASASSAARGQVTDEHIFPLSWYPDDTPGNIWKWQAPSCFERNNKKLWSEGAEGLSVSCDVDGP